MRLLLSLLFSLLCTVALAQIQITYPPDSSTYVKNNITVVWDTYKDSGNYKIEISSDKNFLNIEKDTLGYFADYCSFVLPNNSQYFARIKEENTNWLDTVFFRLTNPTTYPNIRAWYSADSLKTLNQNNQVEQWIDLSGNNNHLLQTDSTKKPTYSDTCQTLPIPSIYFNGETNHLRTNSFALDNKTTSYLFFNNLNHSSNNYIFDGLTVNSYRFSVSNNLGLVYCGSFLQSSSKMNQTFNFLSFHTNGEQSIIRNNFETIKTGNPGTNVTPNGFTLGSYGLDGTNPTTHAEFYAYELILIDTLVSDSLNSVIESYLKTKYLSPVFLGKNIKHDNFCHLELSAENFYTSYLWNTGETTPTISVNKSGTYSVTVTDIFGFTSTDSVKVRFPQPKQQIRDTIICLHDTLKLNQHIKDDYTYKWNTGETNPEISITQAGEYWLEITDNKGCSWSSDTIEVVIDNFSEQVSLGNDTTLCSGNSLYLQNGASQAESYNWSTGSNNNFIVLENSGQYFVEVSNQIGCIARDTINIQIQGTAPSPDFDCTKLCLYDTTLFVDISASPSGSAITSWNWVFGNENSSTQQNPEFVFDTAGVYNITLSISDSDNCGNTINKTIQIYNLPQPDFTPINACSNDTVVFFDKSTCSDGQITNWLWTFPDGTTANTQSQKYLFENQGNQDVELKTTTNIGCSNTVTKSINVRQGPKTDFSFSSACLGQPVYFTDNTESFLNLPLSYEWNFDNLGSSTYNNPNFTFNELGTYNITLTTWQSNMCSSSITKQVTLTDKPIADFSYTNFCKKTSGKIIDASSATEGNIVYWKYIIDSLGTYLSPNITVQFDTAKNFSIKQIIEDEFGCRDTLTQTITVFPLPVVDFTVNYETGAIPFNAVFTNNSLNGANYYWNFGDGSSSNSENPEHTYTDSGLYKVSLIAESENACRDSAYKHIKTIIAHNDIALSNTFAETKNGFLQVSVIIQNRGTLPIKSYDLIYTTSNGQKVKETVLETLKAGEINQYNFTTQLQISNSITLTHICIDAYAPNFADEDLSNNQSCFVFDNAFKDIKPYPNPADNILTVEYIIPYKSEVKILLFNVSGEKTHELYNEISNEGLNRLLFDVSTFETGTYIYQIEFEDIKRAYHIFIK